LETIAALIPDHSHLLEIEMSPNPMRCTMFGGAVVALAMLASPVTSAAQAMEGVPADAPVVMAQASAPSVTAPEAAPGAEQYPSYKRGVRKAATESPEALRRYIWRTRMIYNFWYNDFAPKE
jgi:hypothetical protein